MARASACKLRNVASEQTHKPESSHPRVNSERVEASRRSRQQDCPKNGAERHRGGHRPKLMSRQVFGRVFQKATIPILFAAFPAEAVHAVTALVAGANGRIEHDAITGFASPLAEVHVFKPDRKEPFIKTAERFPGLPANEQESARWLIDFGEGGKVSIQAAVFTVYRTTREDAIEPQSFEGERLCARKFPGRETVLNR